MADPLEISGLVLRLYYLLARWLTLKAPLKRMKLSTCLLKPITNELY